MEEIKFKDIYDCVTVCKKCKKEYGYDVPNKFKQTFCGKTKILPGYIDDELCPVCNKSFIPKPKGLNTSVYSN